MWDGGAWGGCPGWRRGQGVSDSIRQRRQLGQPPSPAGGACKARVHGPAELAAVVAQVQVRASLSRAAHGDGLERYCAMESKSTVHGCKRLGEVADDGPEVSLRGLGDLQELVEREIAIEH